MSTVKLYTKRHPTGPENTIEIDTPGSRPKATTEIETQGSRPRAMKEKSLADIESSLRELRNALDYLTTLPPHPRNLWLREFIKHTLQQKAKIAAATRLRQDYN